MRKNKHSARSLTAFLVTWAFLILTFTGVLLYVVPQGRIAYWIHWSFLGLDKASWGNLHMIFGGLFIVTGALHLYFNWKPFRKYLADRVSGHIEIKRELVVSLAVTLLVAAGAIANVPPLSWVFDLNAQVKGMWITSADLEPPFGHAEELSLEALGRRTGIDPGQAREALDAAGIAASRPGDSLDRIARDNDLTPKDVWGVVKGVETDKGRLPPTGEISVIDVESRYGGTGIGRKTLAQISESTGVDPGDASRRLETAGINAGEGEKFKPLADRYGITPLDLLKTILVPGYRPKTTAGG